MARANWISDDNHPDLDEHVSQLEHFVTSIADGIVDKDELAKQEENLVTAMNAVESTLSDEQHTLVTKLLVELTAYNVMGALHEMAASQVRKSIK